MDRVCGVVEVHETTLFPSLALGFQGPSQAWALGLASKACAAAWLAGSGLNALGLDLVLDVDDGLDAMSGQQ